MGADGLVIPQRLRVEAGDGPLPWDEPAGVVDTAPQAVERGGSSEQAGGRIRVVTWNLRWRFGQEVWADDGVNLAGEVAADLGMTWAWSLPRTRSGGGSA